MHSTFPYILDPQSTSSLLVGTCRVWSGPRSGGAFTALSLNFETFGTGTCAGNEVNVVRSLAAGGPTNANGSQVIYSTTDGPGLNNPASPIGGNIWVTTNATAVSGTCFNIYQYHLNGPAGASINRNQFPISSVAIDTSDPTGNTAYVTVMGFTGGPGHIWQTTNAGASWTDFTGTGANAIPDSPVNAVVVDPSRTYIYVATDVGRIPEPDVHRRLDRTRSNSSWSGINRLPAQRGSHRARNLQFRRPKVAASFHLRSRRVAIQSAGRTGFSDCGITSIAHGVRRETARPSLER